MKLRAEVTPINKPCNLGKPIAEIGIPVRLVNCLEGAGIKRVEDLLKSKPKDLFKLANFGEASLMQVFHGLENVGYSRKIAEDTE